MNRKNIFIGSAFIIFMAALFVRKAIVHINAARQSIFWYDFTKKDTTDHGYILLAPYVATEDRFSNLIIISAATGQAVIKKKISGIVGDFRQWRIDGSICYSYSVYDPAVFLTNYSNGSVAHIVILDSALNEVEQVHLLPGKDVVIDKHQGLDHHDFIMMSYHHFITMAAYARTVSNIPAALHPSPKARVAVPVIQEVRNDSVIWQWDAAAFPEFYALSEKGNNFSDSVNVQDYMHINGMAIDPKDSNLVVSFHNTDQIIKIDRHTGDILWRLGGKNSDFALTPGQVFLRQHDPSFTDSGNTLLLLDNGDSTVRRSSRVLEFRLDERQKKVTGFKALDIPAPFAMNKGNVQIAGDDYLICGGSANYVLKMNRTTGKVTTRINYNQTSFRAYRVNDISGIPADKNIRK